jgi:hypothetical protein
MRIRDPDWRRHKQWIREATLSGLPPSTVATRYGVTASTACRVVRLPRVQRYIASLRRMQAEQALHERVQRELEAEGAE